MNASLMSLEIAVALLGLAILLIDLWLPASYKRQLGYVAALGLLAILAWSVYAPPGFDEAASATLPIRGAGGDIIDYAFGQSYVMDSLALFFKRFFLLAAALVLILSVEFADRIPMGISEFYALTLFALTGMMFASSANHFTMLFVSLELITVTFYILASYQKNRQQSLEAGVKYLILGALSSAFLVYGIALVFGATGSLGFGEIADKLKATATLAASPLLLLGMAFVLVGIGFKIAAFPFQFWAPDVYQGAPTPVTAFLAVGSKAAGFVLLLRVLFSAVPDVTQHWEKLLMGLSALTILYGNLCAIPQRNLKRLLAYSGIANAGYLLLGVATMSQAGLAAVLYYLTGYLFTVLAAFTVIVLVARKAEAEDFNGLAGLHQRSPFLAVSLTLAMVSLAGVPPLAGFFGKFLLLKAAIEQGAINPGFYCLTGVTIVGVVISFWYYFGVIKAIYWSEATPDVAPIQISLPTRMALLSCIAGMFYLGMFPDSLLRLATQAVGVLKG